MNTCYFEKQKWRSKSVAFYNVWGALFGRKSKKWSPRPYELQCFRNAISHTCFFIPSTMNTWYFEKQKSRCKSVACYNVCGALFSKKVQKGEPQTLWFTMFPERIFGKWKCWLGVTEFHHFQKWKRRSENILNHNVCGAVFGQKCKKVSPRPYDLQCFRNAFLESGNVDLV